MARCHSFGGGGFFFNSGGDEREDGEAVRAKLCVRVDGRRRDLPQTIEVCLVNHGHVSQAWRTSTLRRFFAS